MDKKCLSSITGGGGGGRGWELDLSVATEVHLPNPILLHCSQWALDQTRASFEASRQRILQSDPGDASPCLQVWSPFRN